jgi:hypothetical protein
VKGAVKSQQVFAECVYVNFIGRNFIPDDEFRLEYLSVAGF